MVTSLWNVAKILVATKVEPLGCHVALFA